MGETQETPDEKEPETEKEGEDEDVVDMTQDFGGEVTDVPEDGEKEQDSDG